MRWPESWRTIERPRLAIGLAAALVPLCVALPLGVGRWLDPRRERARTAAYACLIRASWTRQRLTKQPGYAAARERDLMLRWATWNEQKAVIYTRNAGRPWEHFPTDADLPPAP